MYLVRQRNVELQSLHAATGQECCCLEPDGRLSCAAVWNLTDQRAGGGGDGADHRRNRQRHHPCYRQALLSAPRDAGKDKKGSGVVNAHWNSGCRERLTWQRGCGSWPQISSPTSERWYPLVHSGCNSILCGRCGAEVAVFRLSKRYSLALFIMLQNKGRVNRVSYK